MFENIEPISFFSMLVSLLAMVIQLIFGMMSQRRTAAETARQIAETKKQEKILAFHTEETFKDDVRNWGRAVVDNLSMAQQLCTIDPAEMISNDLIVLRAQTVGALRGLLNRGKWLFPNLAIPSPEDNSFLHEAERELSALETVLYGYHTLDGLDATDADKRKKAATKIRKLRNEFVREMRRAVDPRVRGEDIEAFVAMAEAELAAQAATKKNKARPSDGIAV